MEEHTKMECNHKQLRNQKWMNLIASDWFSIFLEYLNLYDIIQIDSSFCNHKDRPIWLSLLRNTRSIVVVNDMNIQGIAEWFVLKDVHPSEIIINGKHDKITPDVLLQLSRISSKLKRLKCYTNVSVSICSALFQFLGDHNPLFEELYVSCSSSCTSSLSESDVEHFKQSLKHFLVGCPLLRSLTLHFYQLSTQANDTRIPIIFYSTLFQCLGDYNPLLEKLHVYYQSEPTTLLSESDVEQINEPMKHFLVGCPLLRSLTLNLNEFRTRTNDVCIPVCIMMFQCLGDYNTLFEELDVFYYFKKSGSISHLSESDVEQFNESLKHFLLGCPLLRELTLKLNELPSQCVTTIANYALNLEKLSICGDLLEQGPIITKETNKLKKLSHLSLYDMNNLDDESLINLVTGCNQLKFIFLVDCCTITDISLYSIAENCPNLKEICISFVLKIERNRSQNILTDEVLLALVNKCPKLTIIRTTLGELPKVIQQELNKRLNILTV